MTDFIERTPAEGKRYCLVMVDMWVKWVEAILAKNATADVVTKALVTEVIPGGGFQKRFAVIMVLTLSILLSST